MLFLVNIVQGAVTIWDSSNCTKLARHEVRGGKVTALAFSGTGIFPPRETVHMKVHRDERELVDCCWSQIKLQSASVHIVQGSALNASSCEIMKRGHAIARENISFQCHGLNKYCSRQIFCLVYSFAEGYKGEGKKEVEVVLAWAVLTVPIAPVVQLIVLAALQMQ